jgi:hypothetical protein
VCDIKNGAINMSNQFKRAIIDDILSENIDSLMQNNLINIFISVMKTTARMQARQAVFDTTDFATSHQIGCDGFLLTVTRARADSANEWIAVFHRDKQRLDLIGHLE